jgi:hypothetical protein
MSERSHIRSEELRASLLTKVSEVAETGVSLPVGVGPGRVLYELVPTTALTEQELDACVPVSADRARKNWSDFRATARLLDVTFLIKAGDAEAVFRRHPGYDAKWPKKWKSEHSSRMAGVSPQLTADEPESPEVARLRRELAELKRRVESIERGSERRLRQLRSRP